MGYGAEDVGGAVGKIVQIVRFPFLMQILIPGAVACAIAWPFTGMPHNLLGLDLKKDWLQIALIAVAVLVSGAILSVLSDEIYKIYEGRTLWPRKLRIWGVARQQHRVDGLLREEDEARKSNDRSRRAEIWCQLRMYPTNERGIPSAHYPTILGNVIAGYEQYPLTRYGMDSVFYWPRLWLLIDKEKKTEINSTWSVADGFLCLSAVSTIGGVFWITGVAIRGLLLHSLHVPGNSPFVAAPLGLALIALGYLCYRLSIPFHRQNGEIFKAVFDLYRDKVWPMTQLQPMELEAWRRTWNYLQYRRLKCPHCGEPAQLPGTDCNNQKCGKPVPGFR